MQSEKECYRTVGQICYIGINNQILDGLQQYYAQELLAIYHQVYISFTISNIQPHLPIIIKSKRIKNVVINSSDNLPSLHKLIIPLSTSFINYNLTYGFTKMLTEQQLSSLVRQNARLFSNEYQINDDCKLNDSSGQVEGKQGDRRIKNDKVGQLKIDVWKINQAINSKIHNQSQSQTIGPILSFQRRHIWSHPQNVSKSVQPTFQHPNNPKNPPFQQPKPSTKLFSSVKKYHLQENNDNKPRINSLIHEERQQNSYLADRENSVKRKRSRIFSTDDKSRNKRALGHMDIGNERKRQHSVCMSKPLQVIESRYQSTEKPIATKLATESNYAGFTIPSQPYFTASYQQQKPSSLHINPQALGENLPTTQHHQQTPKTTLVQPLTSIVPQSNQAKEAPIPPFQKHLSHNDDFIPSPEQLSTILKTIQKGSLQSRNYNLTQNRQKTIYHKRLSNAIRYHQVPYSGNTDQLKRLRQTFVPPHPQHFDPQAVIRFSYHNSRQQKFINE